MGRSEEGVFAVAGGTVSFHFSTVPLATSSWCEEGCQPPGRPRCCIRLRPSLDPFRLLAGIKHMPGYRRLMTSVKTTFSAGSLVLTVERDPATGCCGLWTPEGCRLPVEAKPDPCRHYVCKTDLLHSDDRAAAVLDRYNRFWLALIDHEIDHHALVDRARAHFRTLVDGTRHKPAGTESVRLLFDTLEQFRDDYDEYLARRREFVRERLGTESLTATVVL